MALATPPQGEDEALDAGSPSHVRREGTHIVVSLRGEQDMSTANSVAEELAGAIAIAESDSDLVVDLSQVKFMDGTIVTVIIRARNDLRSRSRDLTLRAPSPFAQRILRLCGLWDPRQRAPHAENDDDTTEL